MHYTLNEPNMNNIKIVDCLLYAKLLYLPLIFSLLIICENKMNSYPEFVLKYFLHFRQREGKIHNIKQYLLLYNRHYKDVQRCFYFRENINNNLLPRNEKTNIFYSIHH